MTAKPVLQRRAALYTLPLLALAAASPTAGAAPLDDPNSVITVIQFTARSEASRGELKPRMAAMRDHLLTQPGKLENALFGNRNTAARPHYVGVSRWKIFKDWENLWLNPKTQDLVPGTFGVVK